MTPLNSARSLKALEHQQTSFAPGGAAEAVRLMDAFANTELAGTEELIRFHEALLFFRAYPHNRKVKMLADRMLASCPSRLSRLRDAGVDTDAVEEPDVSGIAGSGLSAVFSYGVARDLAERHGPAIGIDWDFYEKSHHLSRVLPRFLPLFEEDSMVEALVPHQRWMAAAAGKNRTVLDWLLSRISHLKFTEAAELYDSLELMLRWDLADSSAARTRTRLPTGKTFYHRAPLIARKDIQLDREMEKGPLPVEKLSVAEGRRVLALIRDTSAVRYRELHGFTFGDPRRVLRASAGRGVEIYVTVVPPQHRLPLRVYHGGMFFKNGVPVGYFEGLSLFERMEAGFNLYPTFRAGETAWLYARALRLFRQLAGVGCFSIDPYQIGHRNEEAIETGAFWFYRKLGFRPVLTEQAELCEGEERRLENRPGYRTPPRTLRRLAESPLIYEKSDRATGDWDRFEVRNIGFRVQEHVASRWNGDQERFKREAVRRVPEALGVEASRSEGLALALHLAPDLTDWSAAEKDLAGRILRAKAGPDETRCLRLMQRHDRMRQAILALGRGG